MPQNAVNTNDIRNIRDALSLPLFRLTEHMQSLGWSLKLRFPCGKNSGYVAFEKQEDWHGLALLVGTYKFGYSFDNADTVTVTAAAQRSAELCLTIYEQFTTLRPGNPNIYDEITPDRILQKSPYAETTQAELKQRHAHFALKQIRPWFPHQLYFKLHGHFFLIPLNDAAAYLEAIKLIEDALDGQCAITC